MDRLSLAFFAAAFVIAGTAVAGLALRAGVGTRTADASIAVATFDGVVAGGSTREAIADDPFPVGLAEPAQSAGPAETRIAASPVVTAPKPAPRSAPSRSRASGPEAAVDAMAAARAVAAVDAPDRAAFVMAFPAPQVEACAAAMVVPGVECAEIDPAELEAAVARAHEVAQRVHLRTQGVEAMKTRIRRIERERTRTESGCTKKKTIEKVYVLGRVAPTQG